MTRRDETLTRTRARRVAALFLVASCAVLMSCAQVFAQGEPSSSAYGPLMCYYVPGQYVPCGSTTMPQGPDPFQCIYLQAESGLRDVAVTGVQTCALPI